MALVEHSSLPTVRELRREGLRVVTSEEARGSTVPRLRVGLLNMMPDAAFQATERQFIRLVARSTQATLFYVHPFTVEGLPRSTPIHAYIADHYESMAAIHRGGLDALIITGTNVANPDLKQEPFYGPLEEVIAWASRNVPSVLCSCLATHAVLRSLHGIVRTPLRRKQWGVFQHEVVAPGHPLLEGLAERVDVPHSRYNDISREQFQEAGLSILIESEEAGVHAAVSGDDLRRVYWQGHPEYDVNSLLKEYKREVLRHFNGERDLPVFPEHYISEDAASRLTDYIGQARRAHEAGAVLPDFPEAAVAPRLKNTWAAAGQVFMDNWLDLVLQLTTNPDFTMGKRHR